MSEPTAPELERLAKMAEAEALEAEGWALAFVSASDRERAEDWRTIARVLRRAASVEGSEVGARFYEASEVVCFAALDTADKLSPEVAARVRAAVADVRRLRAAPTVGDAARVPGFGSGPSSEPASTERATEPFAPSGSATDGGACEVCSEPVSPAPRLCDDCTEAMVRAARELRTPARPRRPRSPIEIAIDQACGVPPVTTEGE